jgi:hypothetical protein
MMELCEDYYLINCLYNFGHNSCLSSNDYIDGVFCAPSMFLTLWFGFDYGTNPPLGTLII